METASGDRLLPARMLNEFAYCPRLFHLEHVDGLFAHNVDTVAGASAHRRVDAAEDELPEPGPDEPPAVARSVTLASPALGLIAKVDLVESAAGSAIPVDTKKGRMPDVPEGAYEPERVQLCAQALLLREHGFACDHGFLYFAGSRRRVRVDFDAALVARTLELADRARAAAAAEHAPPPLVDSPKCPRCSLVGICLPDEVNLLRSAPPSNGAPRRLVPARDDAVAVYVQGRGLSVGKQAESIVIRENGAKRADAKLKDVDHLAVFGPNQVSTQALQALCGADVPVTFFSTGGWFYGVLHGLGLRNVFLRREQFRAADDPARCLAFAREFVAGKIANARTLLMRNHPEPPPSAVDGMKAHVALAGAAPDLPTLLGLEGNAARLYFANFGGMLKPRGDDAPGPFDFETRNRRPPRDPVNAMLSFGYSLLVKDLTITLMTIGLDPFLGFYHQPRHGRPALALDLMEEFRPLIVDSVVLTMINNGEARAWDFLTSRAGCAMKPTMRARFIAAYERRLDTLVTHPVFDYRVSYRRVLEVQARLLGRVLMGEIPTYPPFVTR